MSITRGGNEDPQQGPCSTGHRALGWYWLKGEPQRTLLEICEVSLGELHREGLQLCWLAKIFGFFLFCSKFNPNLSSPSEWSTNPVPQVPLTAKKKKSFFSGILYPDLDQLIWLGSTSALTSPSLYFPPPHSLSYLRIRWAFGAHTCLISAAISLKSFEFFPWSLVWVY